MENRLFLKIGINFSAIRSLFGWRDALVHGAFSGL
jgi:hypothetical protein